MSYNGVSTEDFKRGLRDRGLMHTAILRSGAETATAATTGNLQIRKVRICSLQRPARVGSGSSTLEIRATVRGETFLHGCPPPPPPRLAKIAAAPKCHFFPSSLAAYLRARIRAGVKSVTVSGVEEEEEEEEIAFST